MRRISGSFWTRKRDEQLQRLRGEGLSDGKIARQLRTTRHAVNARLQHLSGVYVRYPSYIRREKQKRERNARRTERERLQSIAIRKMQQEIAPDVDPRGLIIE